MFKNNQYEKKILKVPGVFQVFWLKITWKNKFPGGKKKFQVFQVEWSAWRA
jgi:hypothetical protein